MRALGKFVLGIALALYYVLVAWKLWEWFAVPLGAPHIPFAHAIGLYALAASVLIWSYYGDVDLSEENTWVLAFAKFLISNVLLLEGFIAHGFMP